jgi:FkbM family methyltransferase
MPEWYIKKSFHMKNKILYLVARFFGKKFFFNFGVVLQHISHRMMGIGNYENEFVSGEDYVVKTMKRLFEKKTFVFFDVGAGKSSENSLIIQKYFNNFKGYLFEPMPNTYNQLHEKFLNNKKIMTFNFALSNKKGVLKLYDYKDKNTEHATKNMESLLISTNKISTFKVKRDTISNFIKIHKIKKINFLKIDVEGDEYNVMLGASKILNKIDFIQFEFNSMNIYSKVSFKDFFDLLNTNFTLYRLYQDGLLKIINYDPIYQEIYEFQNYLAVNKKYDKQEIH